MCKLLPKLCCAALQGVVTLLVSATAVGAAFGMGGTVNGVHADEIVATDGKGDFKTVQAALDAVPHGNTQPIVIYIKSGTYHEKLRLETDQPLVHLIGQDVDKTILTYGDYARQNGADGKPIGTFASSSFFIKGHDFTAENLTFENTAAPRSVVGQAVAVSAEADRSVFRHCHFLAHQDTLYANRGRQYYDDCLIAGDVDFIFGNAAAVFNNCEIQSLGKGYVTAQSKIDTTQPTGYVFINCRLTGTAPDASVYLGRPWRPYARVVYLNCTLGAHILPEGWNNWRDPAREKTAYFGEYNSSGPGAKAAERVSWSHQLSADEARAYQPENFLKGDDGWAPQTAKMTLTTKAASPAKK